MQLLAKKKTDKALQAMLNGLKPQAAGKGIKDYMIMPIQRIPRYQMLLQVRLSSARMRTPPVTVPATHTLAMGVGVGQGDVGSALGLS